MASRSSSPTTAERDAKAPAVAFVTLGCPKNEADSDRMAGLLAQSFRIATEIDEADVLVLNTCAFIQSAVEEAIDEVLAAIEWRAARPGRRLVVAGCLPSRYGEDLAAELPEVDAFVPVAEEESIVSVVSDLVAVSASRAAAGPDVRAVPLPTAYLKVSDGCDRRCAYCTIPAIRGPHRSRSRSEVLAEARMLIEAGVKEIVLVGQDVTRWGSDLSGRPSFAQLVSDVASLDGDYRVRLMYLQPDGVTHELLRAIAEHPRVCRYLDVPVQHASRTVLRAMGRGGDARSLLALVERIREALPDATLRTTVMLGFPGETRRDVEELHRFLRAARFDYVGVFAFSPEEGTAAASLPGQVPLRTRRARAQRTRDLADEIGTSMAARWLGRGVRVLVEGEEEGLTVGRTCAQAPEIDGVTLFPQKAPRGTFVTVSVTETHGYDLFGEADE
ncbi:MAG: 30S ribosomal protein S12 methylthiotransferase RimO [Anaerosomatales bacterium]|nr:30S ribosomal protein S12 methylthiotransferase RimO [Anaerosomatales bacterium]